MAQKKVNAKPQAEEKEIKVLKELDLSNGEVDIRQLSDKDFSQIVFRFLSALLEHASIQTKTLLDLNFSLQLLTKEHLGIDLEQLKLKTLTQTEKDLKINVKTLKKDEKEKVN